MPAYIVAVVTVTDPSEFRKYAEQVGPTIKQHGGRIVCGGPVLETLEGAIKADRVAVVEFPTIDKARSWHSSAEYRAIVGLRRPGPTTGLFLLQV